MHIKAMAFTALGKKYEDLTGEKVRHDVEQIVGLVANLLDSVNAKLVQQGADPLLLRFVQTLALEFMSKSSKLDLAQELPPNIMELMFKLSAELDKVANEGVVKPWHSPQPAPSKDPNKQ